MSVQENHPYLFHPDRLCTIGPTATQPPECYITVSHTLAKKLTKPLLPFQKKSTKKASKAQESVVWCFCVYVCPLDIYKKLGSKYGNIWAIMENVRSKEGKHSIYSQWNITQLGKIEITRFATKWMKVKKITLIEITNSYVVPSFESCVLCV